MRCSTYKLLISRYLDEDLSPRERNTLLAHIGQCPACAATLARYRAIEVALRKVPDNQPSPFVRENLLRRIEGDTPPGLRDVRFDPRWLRAPRLAVGLAALLAIALTSFLTVSASHTSLPVAEKAPLAPSIATLPVAYSVSDSRPRQSAVTAARYLQPGSSLEQLLRQARPERAIRLVLPEYVPDGMHLERISVQVAGRPNGGQDIEVAYGAQDGKSVQIRRGKSFTQPALSENAKRLVVSGREWWVQQNPASSLNNTQAYILVSRRNNEVIVLDAVLPLDELIRVIQSFDWEEE